MNWRGKAAVEISNLSDLSDTLLEGVSDDRHVADSIRVHDGRALSDLAGNFRSSEFPADKIDCTEYLKLLDSTVIFGCNNMYSPVCLGNMTGTPPRFFRELASEIVRLNQNMVKREASRTLTLLERQIVAMMHRLVFDQEEKFYEEHVQDEKSILGVIGSGGTLANTMALWVARNRALGETNNFAGVEAEGMERALRTHKYRSAVVVGSELAHYSFSKAAGVLGLGSRSFLKVPVDARQRMDVSALAQLLDCRQREGDCVLAVIGIAGTTDCGSIDPLRDAARVAHDRGIHFHVDAAWGLPLLLSKQYQHELAGIADADSVSIDGHKQLHLPVGTGMLLFRCPHAARAIEKTASYMLQDESGDLGKYSLEGSRPGTAIFWDAALRIIGIQGYRHMIEENIRKAHVFAGMIGRRADFELVLKPQTNIVLYRYLPPELHGTAGRPRSPEEEMLINRWTERVQKAQSAAGNTYVSRTAIQQGRRNGMPIIVFRAIILNPSITETDLDAVLEDQAQHGSSLRLEAAQSCSA
jgi:glutamate decarboxylase